MICSSYMIWSSHCVVSTSQNKSGSLYLDLSPNYYCTPKVEERIQKIELWLYVLLYT